MTDVLDPPISDDRRDQASSETPAEDLAAVDDTAPAGWRRHLTRANVERWLTVVVVAGAALYVLGQLHPQLVLKNTTPTGGDFGAHVWGPAYLRDHLLPHGRLSGWAPDWYAGFPMYHFYMLPPALMALALDVFLPYGIALKLVSLLPLVLLPVTAWAFGRLSGLPFPIPPMLSMAAVFFLFDETFTIYGGNIASTMAGEFSFAIALTLSLLYLGVFAYGMRTGKYRAWAAGLFALTALCHLIVAFFAIAGSVILFLFWLDRRRFLYLFWVGVVGGLLTAFWMLPFWFRGPYMTDMFYERRTDFWVMFFPQSRPMDWAIMIQAVIGLVGAVVRGYRAGAAIGALAIFYAVWARVWPQSHLWNARLLPFLYLTRYFLVAMGIVEVGRAVARFIRPGSERADWVGRVATLGTATVLAVLVMGLHIQNLPGLSQYYDGEEQRWEYGLASPRLGVKSKPAFVDDWAKWNYSGYEGKDAYGEYHGVVDTMKRLGQERGCGRAVWENNNVQDKYGTPMALMLLPFWTDGCIGSMEGLFFEAAGTTPFHFQSASTLSENSSNPVRRLRYEDGQVSKGVGYLQTLGVRYYLAFNESVTEQAATEPLLTEVARTGPWTVYEVAGTEIVTPLATQPVVVEDVPNSPFSPKASRDRWLEIGMTWFQDRALWPALPAADGPAAWTRVPTEIRPDATGNRKPTDDRYLAEVQPVGEVPTVELPPVQVSDVVLGDDRISFKVDQPGVPVLVRASYFPNWQVSGAWGPYRVAPNFMVVVPTGTDVSLHYGRTPIDWAAYALSLLGVLGLVLLWRRGPMTYRTRAPRQEDDGDGPVAPEAAGATDDLFLAWDEPEPEPATEPPVATAPAHAGWVAGVQQAEVGEPQVEPVAPPAHDAWSAPDGPPATWEPPPPDNR